MNEVPLYKTGRPTGVVKFVNLLYFVGASVNPGAPQMFSIIWKSNDFLHLKSECLEAARSRVQHLPTLHAKSAREASASKPFSLCFQAREENESRIRKASPWEWGLGFRV